MSETKTATLATVTVNGKLIEREMEILPGETVTETFKRVFPEIDFTKERFIKISAEITPEIISILDAIALTGEGGLVSFEKGSKKRVRYTITRTEEDVSEN